MLRINLLLLLAVMTSAIFLVHTQYESRRLFTELDRAEAEARRLATDQLRLQVETSGLYAPQWCPTEPEPWLPALRRAKYWSPVGRVDNVYGDRNLFCSCVPMDAYED